MNLSDLIVDDKLKVFDQAQDADLVASTTVKTVGTGKYIVFSYRVPPGQCLVVAGIAPYLKQRINLGGSDPGESIEYIEPREANDFTIFEPQINDAAPNLFEVNLTAPRVDGAAATLNDNDRQKRRGITQIHTTPRFDAMQMARVPFNRILVPSDALFRIIFSVLPAAAANGLPADGTWSIDNAQPEYRIDFAGCHVYGWQLADVAYKRLAQEAQGQRNKINL